MMASNATPVAELPQRPEHVNRACEACRVLKVRCLPSPDPLNTVCQRCTKTGRNCHYAPPQKRRPRKRTDTRVAELEREVRAMRSLLTKTKSQDSSASIPEDDETAEGIGRKASTSSHVESEDIGGSTTSVSSPDKGKQRSDTSSWGANTESFTADNPQYAPDIVDRGLVSLELAKEYFGHYKNMVQHAPIVDFRPDETFDVVRQQKPIIWLVIVCAVSGMFDPELYNILHREVLKVFAEKYILECGNKSLELVQAFLLTAIWLYPPGDFRRLKFYQYVHMAASMMLDLSAVEPQPLGKETTSKKNHPVDDERKRRIAMAQDFDEIGFCGPDTTPRAKEPKKMKDEPLVIESRRTYLACYLMCSNVALSLRRPNMMPYSPFIGDCITFLKHSPHALPSDRYLVAWSEMQRIAESCASTFNFESASTQQISDSRLHLILKDFEVRLQEWWSLLEPEIRTPTMKIHYYQNYIFLHEYAIMARNEEQPCLESMPQRLVNMSHTATKPISTLRATAILVVIESAHSLLDVVLSMPEQVLKSLPIVIYARSVLALILLIKMSATATVPNSELGKILDVETLKLDYYLREMVQRFNKIHYQVSKKFLPIVVKVAMWHYQHIRGDDQRSGARQEELIKPLLNLIVGEEFVEINRTMFNPRLVAENQNVQLKRKATPVRRTSLEETALLGDVNARNREGKGHIEELLQTDRCLADSYHIIQNSADLGQERLTPQQAAVVEQALRQQQQQEEEEEEEEEEEKEEEEKEKEEQYQEQPVQEQWLSAPQDFNITNFDTNLLPDDMDIDIAALTGGMDMDIPVDMSSWFPTDDSLYGGMGMNQGPGWQWG